MSSSQSVPLLPLATTTHHPSLAPSASFPPSSPSPSASSFPPSFPQHSSEDHHRMPSLSSRAKGKQRAQPEQQASSQPARRKGCHVVVRFTEGGMVATATDKYQQEEDQGGAAPSATGDLRFWAEEADSVADLKWKIRAARPALARRHMRLIHLGRVLSPTLTLVPYIAQLRERASKDDAADSEDVLLQCAVGLEMQNDEEDSGVAEVLNTAPLRGFDLLRATAGLSEDDVRTMRRQFHRTRDTDVELDEAAQALEESWIDGTLTTSAVEVEPATYTTLLSGLAISFFFPLLPLFFFKENESHSFLSPGRESSQMGSTVFPRRMQMAAMMALVINLALGLLMCLS